jgi:hypothetical protein
MLMRGVMRIVLASLLLASACVAESPSVPPNPAGYTPSGSAGSGSGSAEACAPDSVPSTGAVGITAAAWTFTHAGVAVAAGWTQACSGLVECPWDEDDPPVYAQCSTPPFTASATATGAGESTVDYGTKDGSHGWLVTPSTTGTLTIHVETTNTATGEHLSDDQTIDVRDLEDIRFRCFVGPGYFGPNPTPCPSPVPAGTPIAIAVDGVLAGSYYSISDSLTWSGLGSATPSCTGDFVAGDTHYSDYCLLDSGLTQSATVTATAYGVTKAYRISVQ